MVLRVLLDQNKEQSAVFNRTFLCKTKQQDCASLPDMNLATTPIF